VASPGLLGPTSGGKFASIADVKNRVLDFCAPL
jgi:hypothetical protein